MELRVVVGRGVWGFVAAVIFLGGDCFAREIFLGQGVMVGEVTGESAVLQGRLTAVAGPEPDGEGEMPGGEGVACFEYGLLEDLSDGRRTEWMRAEGEKDFIVRVVVRGLQPGRRYFYRALAGESESVAKELRRGSFRTLPGKESDEGVTLIVGSCMNYHSFTRGKTNGGGPRTATEEDLRLGYPAFAAMRELGADYFVGTGDVVYYDQPKPTMPQGIVELRKKWHEQFRYPRLIDYFAVTPGYWSKDDHDFRFNDADLGGEKEPRAGTGIELFREQMPIFAQGDASTPTYRTHRIQKDLQIWLTEGRDYRSGNKEPDGAGKSLWGSAQKEWLKRTLLESDATWKVLISPTPMVGPDDAHKTDNHVNLSGFRHEAEEFFGWLKENGITGFRIVCGDRHWQYHSIHPSGVEEFGCGALNDENSRRGVAPGSAKGTDPEGRIRQPYMYGEPTGGFLVVRVGRKEGASVIVFEHRDDRGAVMNLQQCAAPE